MKETKIERIIDMLETSISEVTPHLKQEFMLEWNSGFYQGLKHALFVIRLITRKKDTKIDTMTEYGYVNVEKNGKKGAIIL